MPPQAPGRDPNCVSHWALGSAMRGQNPVPPLRGRGPESGTPPGAGAAGGVMGGGARVGAGYWPSASPSPSSNSPSSSTVASWYCWYSETRSFMLDSASVNAISSPTVASVSSRSSLLVT